MSEYAGKYGNETARRLVQLQHMESPYKEGTKLDRVFRFMQDGKWHTLGSITLARYDLPEGYGMFWWRRQRTASAIRAIRSRPDLNVQYTGDLYLLELAAEAKINQLKAWVNDLQSNMYINCVYCGHRYGPSDEVPGSMADILKHHIEQCPKHPMSKLKTENKRLDEENDELGFLGVSYAGDEDLTISQLRRWQLIEQAAKAWVVAKDAEAAAFPENADEVADVWVVEQKLRDALKNDTN